MAGNPKTTVRYVATGSAKDPREYIPGKGSSPSFQTNLGKLGIDADTRAFPGVRATGKGANTINGNALRDAISNELSGKGITVETERVMRNGNLLPKGTQVLNGDRKADIAALGKIKVPTVMEAVASKVPGLKNSFQGLELVEAKSTAVGNTSEYVRQATAYAKTRDAINAARSAGVSTAKSGLLKTAAGVGKGALGAAGLVLSGYVLYTAYKEDGNQVGQKTKKAAAETGGGFVGGVATGALMGAWLGPVGAIAGGVIGGAVFALGAGMAYDSLAGANSAGNLSASAASSTRSSDNLTAFWDAPIL
jgi:hypothetical protein